MTKARAPSTFADAVTRIAGRVGWTAMAEAVGKTERCVRNWSDPDMHREPCLDDALALDALYLEAGGGEAPIASVYLVLLKRAAQPTPDTEALTGATCRAAKEVGEAVAALVEATQPGAHQRVRVVAEKEIADAVEALQGAAEVLSANVTPLRSAG
jgi:hypothetical protein